MIGRWFNAWFEDRLAVAIGLAADLRAVVGPSCAASAFREATPDEVAAISQFLAQHALRPKGLGNVVPFPTANDHSRSPSAPPDPAA